jgi:hypothetical protein
VITHIEHVKIGILFGGIMVKKQNLLGFKLWKEPGVIWKGGHGNVSLTPEIKNELRGEFEIEVVREKTTTVMGKEIDLKVSRTINLYDLPEDVRKDLNDIWDRISNLL